jgi:hypothetical protein
VLNLADIRKAGKAIQGLALRTPVIASRTLSARTGHPVWLKLETMQPIGAFKVRGAANVLKRLTASQRKLASSAVQLETMAAPWPMSRQSWEFHPRSAFPLLYLRIK